MPSVCINFNIPGSWTDLSEGQLCDIFKMIAGDLSSTELMMRCLFRWSDTKVIGRQGYGAYLLKRKKDYFEVSPVQLAEILPMVEWIATMPSMPVRPSRLKRRKAITADFSGVPFETYIVADNLYQGFLQTQSDELLDQMAEVLYPGVRLPLLPWQRIAVFYWMASLKNFLSRRFPDFLQPVAEAYDGNLLGSSSISVEAAMNAQIRALTKGDITKEREILALDTWRALTELNAQAKEYKDLNAKIKKS